MRLWQAIWVPKSPNTETADAGSFFIWAESASKYGSLKDLRTLSENQINAHPFACSLEELNADLSALESFPDSEKELTLLLPSDSLGPLCSPKLGVRDTLEREDELSLKKWTVPAIELSALPALALLTSVPKQLPQGLRIDDSFTFWIEVTKLALELLTRGSFIPGIKREAEGYFSHWYPVPISDEDHKRLILLSKEIPPVSRALIEHRDIEPHLLVESFLDTSTDALIRFFLKNYPMTEAADLKTPARRLLPMRWIEGLTKPLSPLQAPDYELVAFEGQLRTWGAKFLSDQSNHPVKPCVRLTSPHPASEHSNWRLEFLLQSELNPTLLLSAKELWSGNFGFLKHSSFSFQQLEECLLEGLGKIYAHFTPLKHALVETFPSEAYLSSEEVYFFLKFVVERLSEQGICVILPDWWGNNKVSVGLHLSVDAMAPDARTRSNQEKNVGLQQLLQFSWSIAIGDQSLSVEDFKALVHSKSPLIEVGGTWVELNPEKVEATLKFLEQQEKANSTMSATSALRLGLGLQNSNSLLPVVGISSSGWIQQLLDSQRKSLELVHPPDSFQGTLREYQRVGVSWLHFLSQLGIGGCLADDMGLGKTIQFLALLLYEQEKDKNEGIPLRPTLLVVPMSILDNWDREAKRFAPGIKTYLHHGPLRVQGEEFTKNCTNADLVITTYSLIHRDEENFRTVSWKRIALDEAQNIKNLDTKQTKGVRALVSYCLSIATPSAMCQRVALTGTPIENHLEELWSIFDVLNPGFLGTLSEFRNQFAIPIERYRDKQAAETLSNAIQPFVLRRLKSDPTIASDLPDKIEMDEIITLTEEQAALYQVVVNDMSPQLQVAEGIHRKGLILATITKLKQICDHPSLYLKDGSPLNARSGKLKRLEELLEVMLAEKDKVLIFSQYAQMGQLLKAHLQELYNQEVLFLHGALTRKTRDQIVQRFQEPEGPSIFILSLKTGGFGLNLTQANQVIHYDQWWNPAVEEQATDRAYRIGQTKNVQVRRLICKGTLEEHINDLLRHKRDISSQIVSATKNLITELSSDELMQLLRMSSDFSREEA